MVRGKNKKGKKVLVSKKARRKRTRARARDKLVSQHWRGGLTVRGNYARMGLAANCNRNRGRKSGDCVAEGSGIVAEMERSAAEARERNEGSEVVYVDWHSKQILTQLIAKHGADYEGMARDGKLNFWQRTPAQLRRQCERLKRALS